LKWIKAINPSAKVLYLEADKKLEEIVSAGIDGINYHFSNFKDQPQLASQAIDKKMALGSWTVNELTDFEFLKKQGVSLITTNYPDLFLKNNK
jgi:glycerophosphoryl diester phosphodiesterase